MKFAFVASSAPHAKSSLQQLIAFYPQHSLQEADVIIALGGDGFLLETLHKTLNLGKPVFGMNRGTVGFLMNGFESHGLFERIAACETAILHPLHMVVTQVNGDISETLAINEVSLLRQTRQAAKISITIDGRIRLAELACDGILLSTPAGSTAYNLSAHGPILPLSSNLLALTPISAFRPRRWRGALLPRGVTVRFDILESEKRPVSATADDKEFRDISHVTIRENRDIGLKLLFDPEHSLEERILQEQFVP